MTHAYLAATGVSVPPLVKTEHFTKVDETMRIRHGQSREIRERMKKIVQNAQIYARHSMNSCWHTEDQKKEHPIEDIFTPYDFDPPAYLRAKFWHEYAPKMAIHAAKEALANWNGSVKDITHVVTTSTTGWAEPGIAVELIEKLGLSEDTRKIEININGCFCGASCLRTARDIVRGGESGAVLVVAVEMSSVQYNIIDTDISSLISSSLFSDGAGAAIIAPEGPWLFQKAGMSLVPNSKHMLRLNPNFEREATATKMFLHQDVPKALADYFSQGRGSLLLNDLLGERDSFPALAVHPGGPNILEGIQEVFIQRGWPTNCLEASYATLHETGNLGSAAILFVLHRLIQETKSKEASYFAFGPGVTVEWASLSKN